MPTTPVWKPARDGFPGDLEATNHASQITQFLGTHLIRDIYNGTQIVSPNGIGFTTTSPGNTYDVAQKFTMPIGSTTIGRVSIPLIYTGNGADVLVSLVPDAAGSPNTANILASTMVPSSWTTNLTAPNGIPSAGPLATPNNYALARLFGIPLTPWGSTTVDSNGFFPNNMAVAVSGNFLLMAGGFGSAISPSVFSAEFLGKDNLANPVPQPSLPQASYNAMLTATSNSLVYCGGNVNVLTNTSLLNTTYVASWDPVTGVVGAWSAQATLPVALQSSGSAASESTVYIVGGADSSANVVSSVYYGTVTNNQLSAWSTGTSLPVAVHNPIVAVSNGWLIVAGGSTQLATGFAISNVYYAKIRTDGSLGAWVSGPTLQNKVYASGTGWCTLITESAFGVIGGVTSSGGVDSNLDTVQVIGVDSNGLGSSCFSSTMGVGAGSSLAPAFSLSNGQWNVFLYPGTNFYWSFTLSPLPLLSVPLYATGLTAGNSYYIMIQQKQSASSSDYISVPIQDSAYGNPAVQRLRNNATAPWTVIGSPGAFPIVVYDTASGGNTIHTWEDPAATGSTNNSNIASRTTTTLYNRYSLPYGIVENVLEPNDPMNLNPTFTSGVTSWTPHNCTFVQSSAQVHGGFSFSGLMTPNGVAAAPNVTSELISVAPSLPQFGTLQWYAANGWFYSPTGWATVSLSIDWYTKAQVFISTSSTVRSIPAATWTNIVNNYQPPSNAAYASLNFIESGTPAAGNTVFFSYVTLNLSNELVQSFPDINLVSYNNGSWPATSVTQLA